MPQTAVDELVFARDAMEFGDELAYGPKYRGGYQRPSLTPKNVKVHLYREKVIIYRADDWNLEEGQPWKVEIWRSGSSFTRATAVLTSADSEGPDHESATLPLREVLDAFRNSSDYVRILKR